MSAAVAEALRAARAIGGGLLRRWYLLALAGLMIALLVTRATLAGTKGDLKQARADLTQQQDEVRRKTTEAKAADAAHARAIERQQAAITNEVSHDYQGRLADARARADAYRLRLAATEAAARGGGAAPVPGVSDPARGPDEAAGEARLPAADAMICTDQALRLDGLQAWIRGQAALDQ